MTTTPPFEHEPVMVSEIVELFAPVPAGTVVDATLGGAGHARALLEAHPQLRVAGLDQDPMAVAVATERLAPFGDRATVTHARFDGMAGAVTDLGLDVVSGVLFDLGVSSPQLDRADRGFSHRFDAALDMRMDTTTGITAADVVNGYDEAELARVLRELGDERYARRIARSIVANRPITTTAQLAEIVRDAIPAPARRTGGHPARRSFQAVRIEVNAELEILPGALDEAMALLAPGGRCVVLAYHSGEDRIVKERFRNAATGGCTCPPGLPCQCGAVPTVRLLKRGAWKPSAAEVTRNPRAESARLRAVEKLPDVTTAGTDDEVAA
jgi:16S rRNA (cytosine1402-N4)-methyltransferase